jgi:hypothetical protein
MIKLNNNHALKLRTNYNREADEGLFVFKRRWKNNET